jgi:predicted site-specific integrase-resolvase
MYITSKKACKELGIHANTLRMADAGKIKHYKTEFGQRRYDVDDYLSSKIVVKTNY